MRLRSGLLYSTRKLPGGSWFLPTLRGGRGGKRWINIFKLSHQPYETGTIILCAVFSIFNFRGALIRSCVFNNIRMLMTTKFLSPASNHSLNFGLIYSSIHLASPFRCQISISNVTSKSQVLIILHKCTPAQFPHLGKWSSILLVVQGKNLGVSTDSSFSHTFIQFTSKSSWLYLQNISRI